MRFNNDLVAPQILRESVILQKLLQIIVKVFRSFQWPHIVAVDKCVVHELFHGFPEFHLVLLDLLFLRDHQHLKCTVRGAQVMVEHPEVPHHGKGQWASQDVVPNGGLETV